MTPQLTDEQRQALEEAAESGPVTIIDSASGRKFVLFSAALYDRYRALFETDDFDIRETYAAQDAAADAAWSHPDDAVYDNYDSHRSRP
ncbi:MAG TPA: hypothetical protein VGY55_24565 [Pirellulales bacterium]|jgi:hypothetical protein|nr:hypothetical protein [Pirellulales bacterium]